jgi:ribonucleoside-diphosphate reductase alpha chain
MPAGRNNAAVGTDLATTLINCFVQPVGDSISATVDGRPGIYPALQQAAETLRRGGGVGYDFSAIRPRGALVRGTRSRASGPVSYMRLFDRSCETLESAGARRGAQMAMLRADHPDIERFVNAKDERGELTNFNISVAASDDFMHAVADDGEWDLVHVAEPFEQTEGGGVFRRADGLWVYRRISARRLFDAITVRSYRHGDPGMVFTDTLNRENNLRGLEHIEATNPCAEQSLTAYGCCCLGSIDLTRLVGKPFTPEADFDFDAFSALVPAAVRMLNDVLDATRWPLKEQQWEAEAKRRVGLGFTGLGDCLIMLGIRYDSEIARVAAAEIARRMRDAAYRASIVLAQEKGSFPLFDPERFVGSPFIQRLPKGLQEALCRLGLRYGTLVSIARTGTISLALADNVSNGIEPAYA